MDTFPQTDEMAIVPAMDIKVRQSLEKINLGGSISYNEPLAAHCTFKVGGPADIFYSPNSIANVQKALRWAQTEKVPYTILGGGANVVPSDKGIRGLVLNTSALNFAHIHGTTIHAGAGIAISTLSGLAADHSLAGLDFIYAMPGSLGGAVYMNARCYDGEMSEIVTSVRYLDAALNLKTSKLSPADFSYKQSPFTNSAAIILEITLSLHLGNKQILWERMRQLEADRRSKGHFEAPCAGSVFKNNHAFGNPSGKIIDSLNLRGLREGGACISKNHANIIVNDQGASAHNIHSLCLNIQEQVQKAYGFTLEPEILFIGDWT